MNESRLYKQVMAIFGFFMTFFYIGVGSYLCFTQNLNYLDKFLRIFVGSTFIFYGLYRAYRTFRQIVEVFFNKDKDEK
jgi:cytochrome c biogenesis protein CcdA